MPQEPHTRCGGCVALFNVTIRTNTRTSPNRNRAKWKPDQHPTELAEQRTDPNQTPATAGVWFYVMAWSQVLNETLPNEPHRMKSRRAKPHQMPAQYDEDGLIERLNDTADITPHRTTPASAGVVLHKVSYRLKYIQQDEDPPNEPPPLQMTMPPRNESHKRAPPKERAPNKTQERGRMTQDHGTPQTNHTPAEAGVNESTPDNPQTHLSPVRKPDRGRHVTAPNDDQPPYPNPSPNYGTAMPKKNEYYTPASAGVIIFNFKVFF
ncbi:hypothetical protein BS47DRAFT_1464673 [Hydnum rufescens UP504]|uniref:Uncharacterized protein n=1 Tax=Hydnum rufescens UP504 TaxID=1448309 RepID=A0A9P6DF93_9AGAM|nr:hypothetical protein BS47DRAFT_1464673 [Hydnum rufescens UP504]